MSSKKSKSSEWWRSAFFSMLGGTRSRAFLSFILHNKYRPQPLRFPIDIAAVKHVLLILPENHLEVLLHLKNAISLITLFKHADVTLLCERSAAAYIKMIPNLDLVEYDSCDHYSSEFSELSQKFRGKFDVCFLLNENPSLPILYLAGSTGAPARIGYCNAGNFPFLNIHIRPSPQKVYLVDRYVSMAEVFGYRPGEIRWRVAQKTVYEIDHLIGELKIDPNVPLVGFDAVPFIRTFGAAWTESFLNRIKELQLGTIYFHVESRRTEEELVWLCKQNVPLFADLSSSRLAALISKSKCIISCNTPMFALAGLLQRPAFGFFKENEIAQYCPQNGLLNGIPYRDRPTDVEIDLMLGLIEKMRKNEK